MAIENLLGRAPEQMSLEERRQWVASWIAVEIYSTKTIPLRRIQAAGKDVHECIAMLRKRGLNPANFEFSLLPPPY